MTYTSPNHPNIQVCLDRGIENEERLSSVEEKTDNITVTSAVNLNTINTAVAALPAGLSGYESRIATLEAIMQFIPKAFGRFTTAASPSLYATSYNVASIARGGTGQYAVTIDTDMTTANYTVLLSYEDSTATIQTVSASSIAATGFNIAIRDSSNSLSDASESVTFAVFENNT
tara:strand:- start:4 stop:525 length:522 start_codon:yes stop_codon:yes gene_type:complete